MRKTPKVLLVGALVGVVGMAFRVSWNALHDVAETVGADSTAATLYPFVVDGLMALALVATLVLTSHDRKVARGVLAGYTVASLALNYVHGLVPELHGGGQTRLADWGVANWVLVLLATSLPVGSIFFGSDLVAKVLHHRPDPVVQQEDSQQTAVNRSGSDLQEPVPAALNEVADPPALIATDAAPVVEPVEADPVPVAVAVKPRPRAATGRVPQAARTRRPTRTPDELLTEARSATAGWTDGELTADAIRKAVHTSSASARVLRDTLKTERTANTDAAVEVMAA